MSNNQTTKSVATSEPLALLRVLKETYSLEEAAQRIALLNENQSFRKQLESDVLAKLYDAANKRQLKTQTTFQTRKIIKLYDDLYEEVQYLTADKDDLIRWCDDNGFIFYKLSVIDQKPEHTYLKCMASMLSALLRAERGELKAEHMKSQHFTKKNGDISFNAIKTCLTEIEPLTPGTIDSKLKEALAFMELEKIRNGII